MEKPIVEQNNIPRNTAASMYNAWFRKEYPELFEPEPKEEDTDGE